MDPYHDAFAPGREGCSSKKDGRSTLGNEGKLIPPIQTCQTEEAGPSGKDAACQTNDAVPTEEAVEAWDVARQTGWRVLVPRRVFSTDQAYQYTDVQLFSNHERPPENKTISDFEQPTNKTLDSFKGHGREKIEAYLNW
ncbi:unnamed protein product [Enterobius vermicularis]|uniref:Uncharacterized protein n=1 Tax=Enterobius vermicularis TaxID=51028 RepID=A0A0N4VN37_ENTVE|nr:unnamed protein product [Enterobius vermicularis]